MGSARLGDAFARGAQGTPSQSCSTAVRSSTVRSSATASILFLLWPEAPLVIVTCGEKGTREEELGFRRADGGFDPAQNAPDRRIDTDG